MLAFAPARRNPTTIARPSPGGCHGAITPRFTPSAAARLGPHHPGPCDREPGERPNLQLEALLRREDRCAAGEEPALRPDAGGREGIHRTHRHHGLVRADSRAAAAPEGDDRVLLRAAELRRRASL